MSQDFHRNATNIWRNISKGLSKTLDPNQIDKSLIHSIFHVGEYYYYIFDLAEAKFLYISPEIEKILNLPTHITVNEFLSLIHPDDRPYFLKFENLAHDFFSKIHPSKLLKYKISYDYRVQKSKNQYVRILHQVIGINHCELGNALHSLGVHTDITHIKSHGEPKLSFIGLQGEPSYYNYGELSTSSLLQVDDFTKKEMEIIRLISLGLTTSEIAEQLYNSEHTIKEHRKNITKKSGLSTSQLIYKAIRNGWI